VAQHVYLAKDLNLSVNNRVKSGRGHELAASLILAPEVDDALAAEQVINGPARHVKQFRNFRNSIQLLEPGFGFALFDLHEFVGTTHGVLFVRSLLARVQSFSSVVHASRKWHFHNIEDGTKSLFS
jgi:hypothetical protein